MVKKKRASSLDVRQAMDFLNQLLADKPILPFVIPIFLVVWVIEKWIFSLTNWVPLAVAVWAVFQYGSYQRKILAEDLNKKWMQVLLETSVISLSFSLLFLCHCVTLILLFLFSFCLLQPTTPLEQCEWLNKLLIEIWPTYMSPRLSLRFSSIVEVNYFVLYLSLYMQVLAFCSTSSGILTDT